MVRVGIRVCRLASPRPARRGGLVFKALPIFVACMPPCVYPETYMTNVLLRSAALETMLLYVNCAMVNLAQ